MMNPTPSTLKAFAALEAQAADTVEREIETGARRYAARPTLLDCIVLGLSELRPDRMIETIDILTDRAVSAAQVLSLLAARRYAERLVEIDGRTAP